MRAIVKDGLDQFSVSFGELAKVRRGEPVHIDPFLIAKAIELVMRECTVRAATGKPIVWNEYRMILARTDFDRIRPLQAMLERDLRNVLAQEANARKAEVVGEMRVTVVFDEGDELATGSGVVRVAFVTTDKLAAPRAGEMTMRFDAWAVAGEIVAKPTDTVIVADAATPACLLRWPGGSAPVAVGATMIAGRAHDGAPPHFIPLAGAGSTVNKQHFWIEATRGRVRIGRYAKANPIHVNGQQVAAGAEIEVVPPAEISLSRGDLVVVVEPAR
jgi:hypothetical protein